VLSNMLSFAAPSCEIYLMFLETFFHEMSCVRYFYYFLTIQHVAIVAFAYKSMLLLSSYFKKRKGKEQACIILDLEPLINEFCFRGQRSSINFKFFKF